MLAEMATPRSVTETCRQRRRSFFLILLKGWVSFVHGTPPRKRSTSSLMNSTLYRLFVSWPWASPNLRNRFRGSTALCAVTLALMTASAAIGSGSSASKGEASPPFSSSVEPRIYQIEELDRAPVREEPTDILALTDMPNRNFGGDVFLAVVIGPTGHVIDARVRNCTVEDFFCRTLDFDAAGNAVGPDSFKYAPTSAVFSKLQIAAAKFSAAAVESARQWIFKPGLKNRQAVYSVMAINIPYNGGTMGSVGFPGVGSYIRNEGITMSPFQTQNAVGISTSGSVRR